MKELWYNTSIRIKDWSNTKSAYDTGWSIMQSHIFKVSSEESFFLVRFERLHPSNVGLDGRCTYVPVPWSFHPLSLAYLVESRRFPHEWPLVGFEDDIYKPLSIRKNRRGASHGSEIVIERLLSRRSVDPGKFLQNGTKSTGCMDCGFILLKPEGIWIVLFKPQGSHNNSNVALFQK